MAKRSSRQTSKRSGRRPTGSRAQARSPQPPSVDGLAAVVVRGGREVLGVEDPLEAEQWASAMLGTFYKLPVTLEARDLVDRDLGPAIARLAEARGDAAGRAVLEAIAAVGDPRQATPARQAADRMAARGIAAPAWAAEIGSVELEGAWVIDDVFGDHEGYYLAFRYPGRPVHLLTGLVDKALGEIVKDASVGYAKGDPESILAEVSGHEAGTSVSVADPSAVARRIIGAVADGDLYLDNDWSDDFKHTRALLLTRMRRLPLGPEIERPEFDHDTRSAIVEAFLATPGLPGGDTAPYIASVCLDYLCDYLGDDPYRWSPIVVEQFLLDFVPRKVSLSLGEVRALPQVLRAWVRFALARRGLEEPWIMETEVAVDALEKAFLAEATDPDNFGPGKSIDAAMRADGVDFDDPAAIDAWIRAYNARLQ